MSIIDCTRDSALMNFGFWQKGETVKVIIFQRLDNYNTTQYISFEIIIRIFAEMSESRRITQLLIFERKNHTYIKLANCCMLLYCVWVCMFVCLLLLNAASSNRFKAGNGDIY